MRISDWSSDVCSSDLLEILGLVDRFAVGLHDAIGGAQHQLAHADALEVEVVADHLDRRRHHVGELHLADARSEEHTSELQSLMRISYAVFCLKKKKK